MTEPDMADPSAPTPIVRWSEEWWDAARPETRARRCTAHRKNEDRCKRLALKGQRVCGHHGGKAAHSLAAARRRLAENADPAVRQLAKIAYDEEVAVEVRLKATLALIDRSVGGAKTSVELEVTTAPWQDMAGDATGIVRMTRAESHARRGLAEPPRALPAGDPNEPVDAELVPDGYQPAPSHTYVPPWVQDAQADAERTGSGLMSYEDAVVQLANDGSQPRRVRSSRGRATG